MNELLSINVNEKVEKKNGLSYLSWAWAWTEVLKIDPDATWEAVEFLQPDGTMAPAMYASNETALVKTAVTIKGKTRTCLLPVMDHRNKAIQKPDAFAINTAIMRCMTKAIGMHGLGLYIYAGEDLPEEAEKEKKPGVIKATDGAENNVSTERRAELDELVAFVVEEHQAGHDMPAIEHFYDLTDNDEKVYVWQQLGPHSKLRATIKANKPQKAA